MTASGGRELAVTVIGEKSDAGVDPLVINNNQTAPLNINL